MPAVRRVLTFAACAALTGLAALWAHLAVDTVIGPWRFDGYCYEKVPRWVAGQAALAAAGVALLLRLVVVLLSGGKRTPRAVAVSLNLALAAALMTAWGYASFELVATGERILCPGSPPSSLW